MASSTAFKPALWIIFIAGILGMILSLFLAVTHYTGTGGACPKPAHGQRPACDIVNQSVYSEVLGIPIAGIAFLVFLWYAIASRTLLRGKDLTDWHAWLTPNHLRWSISIVAAASLVVAGYLLFILYAVLKTACIYCLMTHTLTLIVFAAAVLGVWRKSGKSATHRC
ncbi:hypothetical protein HYU19_01295 [Candidatus Woesearchaeota archaeon]|nr:hypothetical protein [Candidatus Woesearchaeota archaeon]